MRGLSGRRVIVTGGASGIGRATCLRLAEEGCVIGIFDRDGASAEKTAQDCPGGLARAYAVDITDENAIQSGVDAFEQHAGTIDGLANVAGWDKGAPFLETDRSLWDRIIQINLYGPLFMHKAILPRMQARGSGRVVNVASDAGRVGSSGEAVYSACKGGIIAFTSRRRSPARSRSGASAGQTTIPA
jgi:2-hydroxycyclohexanecarboxyl-CoA dehydrogenase